MAHQVAPRKPNFYNEDKKYNSYSLIRLQSERFGKKIDSSGREQPIFEGPEKELQFYKSKNLDSTN